MLLCNLATRFRPHCVLGAEYNTRPKNAREFCVRRHQHTMPSRLAKRKRKSLVDIFVDNYWEHPFYREGLVDWVLPPSSDAHWSCLSCNPSACAIKMLENNRDKLYWTNLSSNSMAGRFFKNNITALNWELFLRYNCVALKRTKLKKDYRYWWNVSLNSHNINLLRANVDSNISRHNLYQNPYAIKYIESNYDLSDVAIMSLNPAAIHILKKHPEHMSWIYLSFNPSAIDMLQAHTRMYDEIYCNPAIFEPKSYHYDVIRATYAALHAELLAVVCAPNA